MSSKKFILEKIEPSDGDGWFYSDIVKEHFFNPHNFLRDESELKEKGFNGEGIIGSPACGDLMKLWIKVDEKIDAITDCRWSTFGCASAIASTSVLSDIVTEKGSIKIEDALKITPQDIIKRMGGLPARKVHCSVLGDKALREAIYDYFRRTGQEHRIKKKEAKIIDTQAKVTDEDIENAVLDGARTFEDLQQKLKIGIQDKNCIPEAEKLLRFYVEKHKLE
ncbi:MAG: iron-sulfur cluster assembly scaffold protein [Candidatus Woesearchaeota archaeon]